MMSSGAGKWIPIDIAGPHDPSRYKQVSNEQLHNMYLSKQSVGTCLFPYPGYKIVNSTIGDANPRGLFYSNVYKSLLGVFGTNVYIIRSPEKVPQIINADLPLSTSDGPVYMAEDPDTKQVMFAAGGEAYLVDDKNGDTFQKAAIPEGVVVSNIVFQDEAFVICDTNSSRWYVSQVGSGKVWPADDRGRIQSNCVAVARAGRQVLVFGTDDTGVFYDAGVIPFPWQEIKSVYIEYGCLAAASIAQGFGLCVWLASNKQSSPQLMVSDGSMPKAISNENIDALIDDLQYPALCDGFIFQQDAHIFYQINFYADNVSLAYDFSTQSFIKISKYGEVSDIQYVAANQDKIYCLLRGKSGIYQLSNKISSNDGAQIERVRITKTQYFDEPVTVSQIRLRMQHGIDGAPFIDRLDDKLVKEYGSLIDKGFFQDFEGLKDAKRGDYWKIATSININGINLTDKNVIISNADISGIPSNLIGFKIATTEPLGKVRVSVSTDFGVTFPPGFAQEVDFDAKGEYDHPYYVIGDGYGSSRTWTFKFEVFSDQPVAIIEAKAFAGRD